MLCKIHVNAWPIFYVQKKEICYFGLPLFRAIILEIRKNQFPVEEEICAVHEKKVHRT